MKLKDAVNKRLSRNELKFPLLFLLSILIVISIFDYKKDTVEWILEILRNLSLSICIGFIYLIYTIFIDTISIKNRWVFYSVKVLLWTLSGFLGALLGWVITDLLFGFHITHIYLFFIIVAGISFFASIILTGREALKDQIKIMAEKISKNEVKEQKLLKLQSDAKLDALRSKVNPHFFFNTLNTIAELIPTDPIKAEKLIERFSTLFRYPFSEDNFDLVPLKKEINFIEDYLSIEKIRLGNRLNYKITCGERSEDVLIPSMILQPLIENSIIHGISPLKDGGDIFLNCITDTGFCHIELSDSGNGFDSSSIKKGFGIKGVEERLMLLYQNNYFFEIRSNSGVNIKLSIPLKRN